MFSNFNTYLNHLEGLLQQFTDSTFRVSDSGNVGWGLRICISKEQPDGAVPGKPHVENYFDLLENHRRYQRKEKNHRGKREVDKRSYGYLHMSNFCRNLFFLLLINICWGQDGLGIWGQQMQTIIYRMDKQQGPTVQHRERGSISCDKL